MLFILHSTIASTSDFLFINTRRTEARAKSHVPFILEILNTYGFNLAVICMNLFSKSKTDD